MDIISLTTQYNAPVCIALGFFDCVHLGHRELFKSVIELSENFGCTPCAATFYDNPYIKLEKGDKLIMTYNERLSLIKEAGIRAVLPFTFCGDFMNTDKDKFLRSLLKLNVIGLVCGHDYRFGKKAQGNAEYLRTFCQNNGIMCSIVPPVLYKNERISSTLIRNLLLKGDIIKANSLLGYSYFISGKVCKGKGNGSVYGYPTANIEYNSDKLLPLSGVYATTTTVDGKTYKSVTNVGEKPTFFDTAITVETLLIDYSGDLYGKCVNVSFVKRLRDIYKFESPIALGEQIKTDCKWS